MLKKSITYKNPFTDMPTTEEFYFHISKADMVRLEMEEHGESYTAKDGKDYTGMQAKLHRIIEAEDGKAMMPLFEDIIRRSYGRRDGDRFIRTEELWQDFKGSGAFDELLFELCTDPEGSADFINAIFPNNLESVAAEVAARVEAKKKPAPKRKPVAKKSPDQGALMDAEERAQMVAAATTDNPVELTQDELLAMDPADLQTGLASGKYKTPGTTAS